MLTRLREMTTYTYIISYRFEHYLICARTVQATSKREAKQLLRKKFKKGQITNLFVESIRQNN